MEKQTENLVDKLEAYNESDYYPFHMPGSKRNGDVTRARLPYEIDITEIEGFDDLHHARGILKEAQQRAAKIYHAKETFFLVNGSTVGILSAILGCTTRGSKVIVARNCHKSVYHAIFLNGLIPVYVYPEFYEQMELNGQVTVSSVSEALANNPEAKAVIITSPTYDGVVSDIRRIAEAAHQSNVPLIVDEAHGAHFGFDSYFPDNANTYGADVVIHSLHKTLPALTQTALLHLNGELADNRSICAYLDMLQTSSPSYILMASIEVCLRTLEQRGGSLFSDYVKLLEETRKRLAQLKYFKLLEMDPDQYDRSKIVISVKGTGMTGKELYYILLEKYHLQMEMAAGSYVLAMTSIGDTQEGMNRLVQALVEIETAAKEKSHELREGLSFELPKLERVYSSAEIKESKEEIIAVLWTDASGFISVEYAYLYPPGIPLIVPGERISLKAAEMLEKYNRMGFSIEGLEQEGSIRVIKEK